MFPLEAEVNHSFAFGGGEAETARDAVVLHLIGAHFHIVAIIECTEAIGNALHIVAAEMGHIFKADRCLIAIVELLALHHFGAIVANESGESSLCPILICEVCFYKEAMTAVVQIADTYAHGVGLIVFIFDVHVAHSVGFRVGGDIPVSAPGVAAHGLFGRVDGTESDTVVAGDGDFVLSAEEYVPVADLHHVLKEGLVGVGGVSIGVVDYITEVVADVDTDRESFNLTGYA